MKTPGQLSFPASELQTAVAGNGTASDSLDPRQSAVADSEGDIAASALPSDHETASPAAPATVYPFADDGSNNFLYNTKTKTINAALYGSDALPLSDFDPVIAVDAAGSVDHNGWRNFVGVGDEADFAKISLANAANLSFTVSATDATKFTVWRVTESKDKKGNTVYSTKAVVPATALKLNKATGKYEATTKTALLEPGNYFISMESTNAAKGGAAYYNVELAGTSVFFTRGDNSDDWTDLKNAGAAGAVDNDTIGLIAAPGEIFSDWVGYGDAVDYKAFTIDCAAKLVFDVTATDAAKFSVNKLVADKKGGWSLKALQPAATLAKAKGGAGYGVTTKELLLDEAGTYYICVQSTNAAKGGNADYTVAVAKNSVFFTRGCNGDDWDDLRSEGAAGKVDTDTIGWISVPSVVVEDGWVGFGDEVDYMEFTLDYAAKLVFDVTATDAAKFSVNQLVADKKGGWSLKALQSSALAKAKGGAGYGVTTRDLLLEAGTYYIGVQSTNAAKGGNADYTVAVHGNSVFFDQGNNDDDTYDGEGVFCAGELWWEEDEFSVTDWVGFGDAVDYHCFTLGTDMKISLNVDSTDALSVGIFQELDDGTLSKSKLNANFKANVSGKSSAVSLKAGTYYLKVTSTNAAKGGNAEYDIRVGEAVAPLKLTVAGDADDIFGTRDADSLTIKGNRQITIGCVELGDGNDRVVVEKSRNWGDGDVTTDTISLDAGNDMLTLNADTVFTTDALDFGTGNDTFLLNADAYFVGGLTDFGDGNDTLQLNADVYFEGETVDFGAGNDVLQVIGRGADIYRCDEIFFGDGNDRMQIGADATADSDTVSFGDGDDTLTIDKGGRVGLSALDFGEGNDSLILNGALTIDGGQKIEGLEHVSGSGQLLLSGFDDADPDDFRMFTENSKIEVVNVIELYSNDGFTDKKTEIADNTRSQAAALKEKKKGLYGAFWLCGKELADSVAFGFADDTDYYRFSMQGNFSTLQVDVSGPAFGELLDAKGNVLASSDLVDDWNAWDLTGLKNGQYYLHLSVAPDAFAGGQIWVY